MSSINIDYTAIDFDALKTEVIQYLKETQTFKDADVTASNINTMAGMYAFLNSLFGYYINSVANEVFLPSAKRYKNLNRICRLIAYNPRGDVSSTLNVIGSLTPEYCFGKEDTYFEIPAYSQFPSTRPTPDNQNFTFTNPIVYPYTIRSFGVRPVDQIDFTYKGISLPITQNKNFWETTGTTGTSGTDVSLLASELELTCSDTKPLSILDRQASSNYKRFDIQNSPLFDPQSPSSIGQPFTRNISTDNPAFQMVPGEIYYVIWNYNSDIGSPFLSILEEGDKLEERRDDIITAIQFIDEGGDFYTLREVQNNAKGRFYMGVLGQKNLESVTFDFDIIEGTENSIKQVHIDVNKSGDRPPYQVLVDGNIYSFESGRISSQVFNRNNWDVNVFSYNVNLNIGSPDRPDSNFNATLVVTTNAPGVNEITIAKIYPSYVDPTTNTATLSRTVGNKFGDFVVIEESALDTSEQKNGVVDFSSGIERINVVFSSPFMKDGQPSEDYVISLTPNDNVQVWFGSKNENGFTINVEPNVDFDGKVYWLATQFSNDKIRQTEVVFETPIPQIDSAYPDYAVFLTPSDNAVVWVSDKNENGFKINSERSFGGTVTWSTFVFSDDENVKVEENSALLQRGNIFLTESSRTYNVVFDTQFPDDSYGLHMVADQNVSVWYTNKTTSGFVVNVESGITGQVTISWFADFSPSKQFQKHGMINFSGQLSSAGTLPGLRFSNIPETFKISNLKQGNVLFSYINRNMVIDGANNFLNLKFTADRIDFKDMKFFIDLEKVSYKDLRVFVKNEGDEWEEWSNASDMITTTNIGVGEKVYFVRVNEYKKIEIEFGDGINYGTNPYGREMFIFGLQTVGKFGNIATNILSDTVILSKEILGDDNISLQFESQFIQLLGLKRDTFFSANSITNPTSLYDSEGTQLTKNELLIKQNTPSFGGRFPETVEELRRNASTANLRQNRIVSLGDYESYVGEAFSDYIIKVRALSYEQIVETGLIPQSDLAKYWFNYVFIVALPATGNLITRDQKEYIINSLNNNTNSMLTVEHELLSAELVPVDVRIRYKRTTFGSASSIESQIRQIMKDYFVRDNRELGEKLKHSQIIDQIMDINGVDFTEMAWNKNKGNLLNVSDYNTNAVVTTTETVEQVKRRKVLELLAKDPSLLKIIDPLFDIQDPVTNKRTWVFSSNLQMEPYEFPILGDIIIEASE
jgi:hypothetical protein